MSVPWTGLLLLVSSVVLLGGCRCGPSEELLPANRTQPSSSVAAVGNCPSRPEWAGPLAVSVEIEILHTADSGSGPHGTGYRLHDSGRFETYDDVVVEPDDAGRMSFKKVPGEWRTRGTVAEESMAGVRKLARDTGKPALTGKQTTKVDGGKTFTVITTRMDGAVSTSCYYGQLAPSGTEPIQKAVHDLVNRVRK